MDVNGVAWHFFAVLDGHQGAKCAKYVKERLWGEIKMRLPEKVDSDWESEGGGNTVSMC